MILHLDFFLYSTFVLIQPWVCLSQSLAEGKQYNLSTAGAVHTANLSLTASEVCQFTSTTENWKAGNYSDILRFMIQSGPRDKGWIKNEYQPALGIVLSYAPRLDNYHCNLTAGQRADCDSQDLGSDEVCELRSNPSNSPAAVTIVKSMANFANYMFTYGVEAQAIAGNVLGEEEALMDKFGRWEYTKHVPDPNSGTFAVLSIVAGLVGFIPEIGPVLGFAITTLVTLFRMQTETIVTNFEPALREHIKFQDYIIGLGGFLRNITRSVANVALNLAPANNVSVEDIQKWAGGASGLPRLISDGRFADVNSDVPADKDLKDLRKWITHSAVNKLWKDQLYFIVRWTNNDFGIPSMKGDLCAKEHDFVPFFPDIKKCDGDGYIYMLQRWEDDPETLTKPMDGWNETESIGTNLSEVYNSSWSYQKTFGKAGSVAGPDSGDVFYKHIEQKMELPNKLTTIGPWQLPVCDLESIRTHMLTIEHNVHPHSLSLVVKLGGIRGRFGPRVASDAALLFQMHVICRCPYMKGWIKLMGATPKNMHERWQTICNWYVRPNFCDEKGKCETLMDEDPHWPPKWVPER